MLLDRNCITYCNAFGAIEPATWGFCAVYAGAYCASGSLCSASHAAAIANRAPHIKDAVSLGGRPHWGMAGKADSRWIRGSNHHRLHGRRGCRLRRPCSSHNATTAHP